MLTYQNTFGVKYHMITSDKIQNGGNVGKIFSLMEFTLFECLLVNGVSSTEHYVAMIATGHFCKYEYLTKLIG